MDDRGAHVVVARRCAMRVLVLLEDDRVPLAVDRDLGHERVRFGNFVDRFQIIAPVGEGEGLPRAVRALCFDADGADGQGGAGQAREAEARRNAVLEHFEDGFAVRGSRSASNSSWPWPRSAGPWLCPCP